MTKTLSALLPARLASRAGWLGVDIGAAAVKLAQVERSGDAWHLRYGRVIPVVPGHDPLATAAAAVRDALGGHWRWLGQPAACVATPHLDLRSVNVPAASAEDALQHAAAQLGIASEMESLIVWPSARFSGDSADHPHHAICVSRPLAEQIADRLLEGRAECNVLDSLPHCLARLVPLSGGDAGEPVAVIDWAAENPVFVMAQDGQPFYTRLLRQCGYAGMVHSVAHNLDLETADVWKLLAEAGTRFQQPATPSPLATSIARLTQTARSKFLEEIIRTLSFLKSETGQFAPQRLLLVGGGAALPGIAEEVSEATQIPAAVWNLYRESPADFDTDSPAELLEDTHAMDPVLASAISLSAIPLL